jgi:hypothetical protein
LLAAARSPSAAAALPIRRGGILWGKFGASLYPWSDLRGLGVARVPRAPRGLLKSLSRFAARKKERETRIITVDELVEMLKGPNVIAVPPLMYQLEQMPPKLRAFFEQGSGSGSPETPLPKTR